MLFIVLCYSTGGYAKAGVDALLAYHRCFDPLSDAEAYRQGLIPMLQHATDETIHRSTNKLARKHRNAE